MNKALAAVLIGATLLSGTAASARDHDGRSSSRQWDGDRDHRRGDDDRRRDHRQSDRREWNNRDHDQRRVERSRAPTIRYYGGNYGYNGYTGPWRSGQRFPYYNQTQYVVRDYGAYGLPAPQNGYQYYQGGNGDIVSAAISSGLIGLIVSGLTGGQGYGNQGYGYGNQGYGYGSGNQGYNGGYNPYPAAPRPYYGY